jgi:hypothetical protein
VERRRKEEGETFNLTKERLLPWVYRDPFSLRITPSPCCSITFRAKKLIFLLSIICALAATIYWNKRTRGVERRQERREKSIF